eukprot:1159542-Pelagomonas_calceolata.AAC.1
MCLSSFLRNRSFTVQLPTSDQPYHQNGIPAISLRENPAQGVPKRILAEKTGVIDAKKEKKNYAGSKVTPRIN